MDLFELKNHIVTSATAEGFDDCAVVDIQVSQEDKQRLQDWLQEKTYGEMTYLARHADIKMQPARLLDNALRVICVRMTYLPQSTDNAADTLNHPQQGYIAQYALGRDYHKVVRKRLSRLVDALRVPMPDARFRVCCDSAPLMEITYASRSTLGWRGKHGLLVSPKTGSFFVLGEILTDLPLPIDKPIPDRCGRCTRCIDACPTGALRANAPLQANRCISYLTIEHRSAIPESLRALIGNRIFGCDDCQFACPWNRFAMRTRQADFHARPALFNQPLTTLFNWTPDQFDHCTAGSPLRRLQYGQWLRNIAVALGNAPTTEDILDALRKRAGDPNPLVAEHVQWALAQHAARQSK